MRHVLPMLLLCACTPDVARSHAPTTVAQAQPGDRDGDSVPDASDRCPDEPEDHDDVADGDGCVDRDNDGDGVPDAHEFVAGRWTNCDHKTEDGVEVDCRAWPEDAEGDDNDDGCPDFTGKRHCRVRLWTPANFDPAGKFDAQAAATFDEVAAMLIRLPEETLRVEGHVDDTHDAATTRQLATVAAHTAIDELVRRGVARERLEPVIRGKDIPFTTADSDEGRARNRRVEFMLPDTCEQPAPPSRPEKWICR